jgi:hypothetical protein
MGVLIMVLIKKCKRCEDTKPASDFYKSAKSKDGLSLICKDCLTETRRLKNYNLSNNEYKKMYIKQGGFCPICGKHETELGKKLVIDHNHQTGKNRSLLCSECNRAIGYFHEDTTAIENAIQYLKAWENK